MIYYLSLIGFFGIFSTTISKSPVLPLYVHALGGSDFIVGFISAFSPLAGILFSFPIGLMSDKIGRKKLLLVSAIIFVVAPLLYLSVSSPMWLIPIRFFHGIATAILGPVSAAMIVKAYETSKGEKLGLYSSATLVGRALAPMLGGFIISYFATQGAALMQYTYVYVAAFILAIPVFIFTVLIQDEAVLGGFVAKDLLIDLKYFLANKRLFSTASVEMATYFAYGALETYLPLYLTELNVPAREIGLIFSVQILSIALSQPLFGKLADVIDKRKLVLVGILTLGLAIGVLGYFQSVIAAMVIGLVFALGLSFTSVATSSYVAEVTEKDKLGASLGALSAIMDIGQTVGPFVTGIAITYFSYTIGFMLSLALAIITAGMFAFYNWRKDASVGLI